MLNLKKTATFKNKKKDVWIKLKNWAELSAQLVDWKKYDHKVFVQST